MSQDEGLLETLAELEGEDDLEADPFESLVLDTLQEVGVEGKKQKAPEHPPRGRKLGADSRSAWPK